MPTLKTDEYFDDEDWQALEDAPEESSFEPYDGPQPPKDTILYGYVKKMWWTLTAAKPDGGGEDPMIVCLWIAEGNEGDEKQYEGLPVFSYWPLVPGAKFRWAPAFTVMGFTLRDVRNKIKVVPESEEDNVGIPITSIGSFKPGEDSDKAWCRILTEEHTYDGVDSTKVGSWLPWEDEGEVLDEPEEPEEVSEDVEGSQDVEQEEAPAPTRGRRAARESATTTKPTARTESKASAARPTARGAARSTARPSATERPARSSAAKPSGRKGRPAADEVDEEPPF